MVGAWPDPMTLRRGWAKAVARPWNDDVADATVRLERGSSDFLRAVAEHLAPLGSGSVYSPALYAGATRVWSRAGFARFGRLEVMECELANPAELDDSIRAWADPDWDEVVGVDRLAFEGFWRMSKDGLVEAMEATPRSAVFQALSGGELAGYALVGAQMGLSFLQRVAVAPAFSGQGLGASLVRASQAWGRRAGARIMILNLRPENDRARRLYEREGFRGGGSSLQLLRFEA